MRNSFFLIAGLCLLVLVSCVMVLVPAERAMHTPINAIREEIQVSPTQIKIVEESAFISSIYMLDGEPDSGTVEVVIEGFFPDGCTKLYDVNQSRERSAFTIQIFTERVKDDNCSMMMEPFTIFVPLDVQDFMVGQICRVIVYDLSLEFSVGQPWRPEDEGD